MASSSENDTRVNKNCKYNACNKRGNSNTEGVSLFGPPCTHSFINADSVDSFPLQLLCSRRVRCRPVMYISAFNWYQKLAEVWTADMHMNGNNVVQLLSLVRLLSIYSRVLLQCYNLALHRHFFINCLYRFIWLFCDLYCCLYCVRLSHSVKTTYLLTYLLTYLFNFSL